MDYWKKRILKAGLNRLQRRAVKAVPVLGTVITLGMIGREMKLRGPVRGAVNAALDMTPVVGAVKAAIEVVVGDLIPPRPPRP